MCQTWVSIWFEFRSPTTKSNSWVSEIGLLSYCPACVTLINSKHSKDNGGIAGEEVNLTDKDMVTEVRTD